MRALPMPEVHRTHQHRQQGAACGIGEDLGRAVEERRGQDDPDGRGAGHQEDDQRQHDDRAEPVREHHQPAAVVMVGDGTGEQPEQQPRQELHHRPGCDEDRRRGHRRDEQRRRRQGDAVAQIARPRRREQPAEVRAQAARCDQVAERRHPAIVRARVRGPGGYCGLMPVSLLGAAEIRALAAELDVTPTKKLGQNFVVDANTVRKIVHVAGVEATDRVVEVGPGLGSLTLAILETGASVTAVEIDHRLAERLPETVGGARCRGRRADGPRCRRAAGDRASGRPDGPGRQPSVQRQRARPPALPRDVPEPAARGGHGAGRGRRASRRSAGLEDLRRTEREGRVVRTVAARRRRLTPGLLARAERRQRAGRVRARCRGAGERGRAAPHLRDRGCRLPAAPEDAQAGAVTGARRHVGRGDPLSWREPESPRLRAARSCRSRTSSASRAPERAAGVSRTFTPCCQVPAKHARNIDPTPREPGSERVRIPPGG